MKTINQHFFLLAAAMLTAGAANAQTTPNPKPTAQGRTAPGLRAVYGNAQTQETRRTNAIDNQSYVSQTGLSNYGVVTQTGTQQVADMVQVNNSSNVLGNDGYQTQSNGVGSTARGVIGHNDAYMRQEGAENYADQTQMGNQNVAITYQGQAGAARNTNYSVQDQTGGNNYGYVSQDSNNNFAHQKQTSGYSTPDAGGAAFSNADNGNYAVTLQGGGSAATNGGSSDGQWSQTIQNGQNNRATVSQDH